MRLLRYCIALLVVLCAVRLPPSTALTQLRPAHPKMHAIAAHAFSAYDDSARGFLPSDDVVFGGGDDPGFGYFDDRRQTYGKNLPARPGYVVAFIPEPSIGEGGYSFFLYQLCSARMRGPHLQPCFVSGTHQTSRNATIAAENAMNRNDEP